ncbi:hypothetical protein PC128_g17661 [Phytophthora cactorum]|nr:hypothetical protein PC120_g15310 [Phytophthora cactorum]KAG3175545.1 hypothetical protein PC128_g17661 [Phytophthora cactorum]
MPFFKRIFCQFDNSGIPTICYAVRDSQAKGDALVPHRASQDGFQTGNWSRHQLRDASTARSLANSDLISELAVAAALNAYKPGIVSGPGRLGNDWYRSAGTNLAAAFQKLV